MRFFKIFKDFENCIDPVKTEEVIFFNLKNDSQNIIYKDYIYIVFPIAESINYYGIDHTQTLINSICKTFKGEKLFFVCQHILVNKLNFYNLKLNLNLFFQIYTSFSWLDIIIFNYVAYYIIIK